MKVAILTPYSLKDKKGGVEIANQYLEKIFKDVDYIYFNSEKQCISQSIIKRVFYEEYMSFVIGKTFIDKHKNKKYDLVISNGMFGWYLALNRVKVNRINIYHGTYTGYTIATTEKKKIGYFINRYVHGFFERLSGQNCKVITVSEFNKKLLKEYYKLESNVINLPVDPNNFPIIKKENARKALGIDRQRKYFLFVGRIEESKGSKTLEELIENYPNYHYIIIGEGTLNKEYKNTEIINKINNNNIYLYYNAVDGVIIPSKFESASLVALEAMVCGTPIIMNETGYAKEIKNAFPSFVTNSNNFLRDFSEFSRNTDCFDRQKIRNWVNSHFSLDSYIKKWSHIRDSNGRD